MSASSDALWYISRDDQRFGPFSADEFARFEGEGWLRPTDQLWQTGVDEWIAYSDYDARKAAARFVGAHRPNSSTTTDKQKCAICLVVRRGMLALTKTLTTTFHSVSTHLAKYAATRTVSDRKAKSIRPAARHDPIGVIGDHSKQDQGGSMPDVTIEDVVEPLRRSPFTPRLASEGQAAAHLGLELATFRAWVADGRLPRALPDCGKYDMKAIHLALDRMSGIGSRENGSNDELDVPARDRTDTGAQANTRDAIQWSRGADSPYGPRPTGLR